MRRLTYLAALLALTLGGCSGMPTTATSLTQSDLLCPSETVLVCYKDSVRSCSCSTLSLR